MIGTIEDLERDIEQFQKNVAASGEMVQLLKEMVASIRQQNIDFEARTNSLLSKVNSLPATIEGSNSEMQEKIKGGVASELDKALKELSLEQAKYIQGLEITKQQIQNYIEQSKLQEQAFSERVNTLMAKIDGIPDRILSNNERLLEQIKRDFAEVFTEKKAELHEEQAKYISSLQKTNEEIQKYIEQSRVQEKSFVDKASEMIDKMDATPERIASDNEKMLERLKKEVDEVLAKRNGEFVAEQGKYFASLNETDGVIKECEGKLSAKYNEFIDTLDKMNLSNLYEQNVQLKNELNKRTTILMVISGVSLLLGVIGLIL